MWVEIRTEERTVRELKRVEYNYSITVRVAERDAFKMKFWSEQTVTAVWFDSTKQCDEIQLHLTQGVS